MSKYTEYELSEAHMRGLMSDLRKPWFDRWLAEVKAEAWDEGFLLATRNNPNRPHPMLRNNPYRTEES